MARERVGSVLTALTGQRDDAVRAFQNEGCVRVFLVSTMSGGVGLNLTAANCVGFLDNWWNYAVEDQALSRVHRFGQMRDVTVYRFIVEVGGGEVERGGVAHVRRIRLRRGSCRCSAPKRSSLARRWKVGGGRKGVGWRISSCC
jgi:hypothetical protein